MKFGINLYGVLKDRKDTMDALRELRGLGYQRIEPCIAPAAFQGWEHVFWPADWLAAHLEEIRDLGLEIVSAHLIGWDASLDRDRLRELAERTGIRQLVVKSPQELTELSLHQAALGYMQLADALQDAGAELLLHNEQADIQTRIGGRTAYERLLSLCLGKVGAQVDVGWALAGGQDPEALLWRLGSGVKSLHYKDFRQGAPAVIGQGDVDVTACFQFARAMGIPQLVDQDEFTASPAQDLADCLRALAMRTQAREHSVSYLNILDVETGEVKTLRRFEGVIEAPNWLKGRGAILYNADGHLFTCDLETGDITGIDTGACDNCNNDHVLSPDERSVAVSHGSRDWTIPSRIYTLPIGGGAPKLITPIGPSYLHGWSPDGQELAYCAFREHEGRMEVNIYTIPAEGGAEKRLTLGGFNDGPEYAPDGQSIWFNSTRTGLMQIWRMDRDGGNQTQMTFHPRNNWFAHLSPDGQKVVYLSYGRDDLEAWEHLPNMQVELRMMNADGTGDRRLLSFFGGQGSINVNSWAADSRHIAFVSYEFIHP